MAINLGKINNNTYGGLRLNNKISSLNSKSKLQTQNEAYKNYRQTSDFNKLLEPNTKETTSDSSLITPKISTFTEPEKLITKETAGIEALNKQKQESIVQQPDTRNILDTAKYTGKELLEGYLKGTEGLIDFGVSGVGALGGFINEDFRNKAMEFAERDRTTETMEALFGGLNQDKGKEALKNIDKNSYLKSGTIPGEVPSVIGRMGSIVGTGGLLGSAGVAKEAVTKGGAVLNPSTLGATFLSSGGSGVETGLNEGLESNKAMLYGIGQGAIETGTEALFSGVPIFGKKGTLDKFVDTTVDSVFKTPLANAITKYGFSSVGEGIEEVLADGSDFVLRKLMGMEPSGANVKDDLIMGTLVGALLGGGQVVGNYQTNVENIKNTGNISGKTPEALGIAKTKKQPLNLGEILPTEQSVQENIQQTQTNLADNTVVSNETGVIAPTISETDYQAIKDVKFNNTELNLPEFTEFINDINKLLPSEAKVTVKTQVLPDKITGMYKNGEITINENSVNPYLDVAKHELTHHLENFEGYQDFQDSVLTELGKTGQLEPLKAELQELYSVAYAQEGRQFTPNELNKEIVANFVQENLFSDEQAINRLTQSNRNFVQKIYDWISDRLKTIKINRQLSNEQKQLYNFLNKAEKLYSKALRSEYDKPTLIGSNYALEDYVTDQEQINQSLGEAQIEETKISEEINVLEQEKATLEGTQKEYLEIIDPLEESIELESVNGDTMLSKFSNRRKMALAQAGLTEQWESLSKKISDINMTINEFGNKEIMNKGKIKEFERDTEYNEALKNLRNREETMTEKEQFISQHQLSEENLNKMLDNFSGLPMPSIAVTRDGIPFSWNDGIKLFFNESVVDPKVSKKNKLYGTDAYTSVFPKTEVIDGKQMIEKYGVDYLYSNGDRKPNSQLYLPFNEQNVLKEMKKIEKAGDLFDNMSGYGSIAGNIAKNKKPFSSLIQAQQEQARLTTKEEEIAIQRKLENEFGNIKYDMMDGLGISNETVTMLLNDTSKSDDFDIGRIIENWNNIPNTGDINMEYVTPEFVEKVKTLFTDISEAPTNYFEAKPQRIVEWNEVEKAIVSPDTSQETINKLKEKGIEVEVEQNVEDAQYDLKTTEDGIPYDTETGQIVPEKTKESSFVGTAFMSDITDNLLGEEILNEISQGKGRYVVVSDKGSIKRGKQRIKSSGYNDSVAYLTEKFNSGERLTKDDGVRAQLLIEEAMKKGDIKTATDLIFENAIIGAEYGQFNQSLHLIKKATPQGRLLTLQKFVNRLNNGEIAKLNEKNIKKGKEKIKIEIPEDLQANIINAQNQEELESAVNEAVLNIEQQRPLSKADKTRSWRYLAMLGNPRTHVRNIVGNSGMTVVASGKNKLAGAIEDIIDPELRYRTSKKSSKETKDYAKNDSEIMKEAITGSSKYDNVNKRRSFDNKGLQKLAELNFGALEVEDWMFSKPAYEKALANYMTANNYTPEFFESDTSESRIALEKGREFATKEAQEQTFRTYSEIAKKMSNLENYNSITKLIGGGILPFKTTPINILKTGAEYGPLNLAKIGWKINKGNYANASELINDISKTMTGTGILVLGMALAKSGRLIASGSDEDNEKYFQEGIGYQPYSIKIGDKTYTLDWASPVAIPLFFGAEMSNAFDDEKDFDIATFLDSMSKSIDPLTEMSLLQGLNRTLSSYEDNKLGGIMSNTLFNYLGQYVPTLSGQVARTIDPTRRTTYAPSDSELSKPVEQFLRRTGSKIPGVSQQMEPYLDQFGQEQTEDNVLLRAFQNFLSPGYIKDIDSNNYAEEIQNLYDETGETSVLPRSATSSFTVDGESIKLDSEEYTEFNKKRGETILESLSSLIDNPNYDTLTSEEKAKSIEKLYDYGYDKAKYEYSEENGLGVKPSSTIEDLEEYEDLSVPMKLIYDASISTIKGNTDINGDTVAGSTQGKKAKEIMGLDASDDEKNILLDLITTSKTPQTVDDLTQLKTDQDYTNYFSLPNTDYFIQKKVSKEDISGAMNLGMSASSFKQYTDTMNEFSPTKYTTKKGTTSSVSGDLKDKMWAYLQTLDISNSQKQYLFNDVYGYDDYTQSDKNSNPYYYWINKNQENKKLTSDEVLKIINSDLGRN